VSKPCTYKNAGINTIYRAQDCCNIPTGSTTVGNFLNSCARASKIWFYRAGLCSNNILELNAGGVNFDSQTWHNYADGFLAYLTFLPANNILPSHPHQHLTTQRITTPCLFTKHKSSHYTRYGVPRYWQLHNVNNTLTPRRLPENLAKRKQQHISPVTGYCRHENEAALVPSKKKNRDFTETLSASWERSQLNRASYIAESSHTWARLAELMDKTKGWSGLSEK
jgi:hypothetical protein